MSEKWFRPEFKSTWFMMASVVRWLVAAVVVGVLTGTVFGEDTWLQRAYSHAYWQGLGKMALSESAVVVSTTILAIAAVVGAIFLLNRNYDNFFSHPSYGRPRKWQWVAEIVLHDQHPLRQVCLYHLVGMLALLPAEILILPFHFIVRCTMRAGLVSLWRRAD